MAKKQDKGKKLLFSVDGFEVYSDSEYRVEKKIDRSAPAELVKLGSGKYPGATDTVVCPFNQHGGVYDTGFYDASPMYFDTDVNDTSETVKARVENVLKPFLRIRGFSHNDKFTPSDWVSWDSFLIELRELDVFNTRNPDDVMKLYIALVGKKLSPPDFEESSEYASANFKVINLNENVEKKSTHSLKLKEADGIFITLLRNDRDKLMDVLSYIERVNVPDSPSDHTLDVIFEEFVKPSTNSLDKFFEVYEKTATEDGATEIKLHRIIQVALRLKDKDYTSLRGSISYKGKEIGKSAKDAASNLVKLKELSDTSDEIILSKRK